MRLRKVLRERTGEAAPRVTSIELFFDLVYVFAITQLSEFLFGHLSLRGGLEALILFLAVWWAWNYTAWATNWIDPERAEVALLMVVLMAISLVMSAAIPDAFASRGLPFAGAYVALQLIRSAFMVFAFGPGDRMRRNYAQLLAWSAIAGVLWVAGAFVHGNARLAVWGLAIVLDVSAPSHGFSLPRLGATPIQDWTLGGTHLAERCQLVLMIALGESVLRVGQTFSEQHGSVSVDGSFVLGFIITASLWGIYFLRHAERGAREMSRSPTDSARLGRAAYAYAHGVMVAGVIVVAVAVRLTIEDPGAAVSTASAVTMLGGPILYLVGMIAFKRSVHHGAVRPPLAGIGVLILLGALAPATDRLTLCVAAAAVLVALAVGAGLAQTD